MGEWVIISYKSHHTSPQYHWSSVITRKSSHIGRLVEIRYSNLFPFPFKQCTIIYNYFSEINGRLICFKMISTSVLLKNGFFSEINRKLYCISNYFPLQVFSEMNYEIQFFIRSFMKLIPFCNVKLTNSSDNLLYLLTHLYCISVFGNFMTEIIRWKRIKMLKFLSINFAFIDLSQITSNPL